MIRIRERAGWLVAGSVLAVAFFLAPILLFGSNFAPAAARDFPPFVVSGANEPSGALADLAATWSWFHVVKAVCAAALVAIALHLGHRALALIPAVLMIANIQGAAAPLSSALSLLDAGDPSAADAVAVLRSAPQTAAKSPAVDHLVRDFAWYHGILAAMFIILVAVMVIYAVRALRQGRRWWAFATVAGALIAAIVSVANVSTTLNPAQGLALL